MDIKCYCNGNKLIRVFLGEDSLENKISGHEKLNRCEKLKSMLLNSYNGETVDFSENIDWNLLNLTDFEKKVLIETFKIPKGQVKTYKEIGDAIGSKAYRAVGNALNKNPIAIAIPCHRVVGSNMDLTGFRGGISVKKQMLINEGIKIKNNKILKDCPVI
jgi:methylated-DNA-[protein]-cysteine S-methyltransferase